MRYPRILFRIWYSTTYTVLFIILLGLTAVAPTDHVYQAFRRKELENIFIVAGVYILTIVIAIFIYASRLYTNRIVLAAIPKSYIPIEPGEVGKNVRRIIVKNLKRSATIAWDSRPRDTKPELGAAGGTNPPTRENSGPLNFRKRSQFFETTVIPIDPDSPPWGHIAHPGWSSPSLEDLPNLQFRPIIMELPNLIEAKAVSLAPPNPIFETLRPELQDIEPTPDARIVELLQRSITTGLREYLAQLSSVGLINPPHLGAQFLAEYEYARFSTFPLTEEQFRSLMAVFARILSGMVELDPEFVDQVQSAGIDSEETSIVPLSVSSRSSNSNGSAIRYRTPTLASVHFETRTQPHNLHRSQSGPSGLRTPSSQRTPIPRTPSMISLGSVKRHPSAHSTSSGLASSSSSSLRSAQSVIRLTPNPRPGDLPYQFDFSGS
ncbi:hypothetical protein M501DRAFT_1013323 [Patellaria atrata CBS 101060]|uniref:Defect at low temperature protein 1 n=1 Tax=Patellaria atrata CBS 101060 TaxID=1346257 RepID=A0A9P4SGG5_9PEZI|nr:hypothetical protein M501DRAFT_1013323 [Patellaria atrata CBS 101060]